MTKYKKQKAKTWNAFSKYIRTRDCIAYLHEHPELNELQCACISCGRVKLLKEGQAGHAVDSRCNSILFDEELTNFQCYRCNVPLKGNHTQYSIAMIKKYGLERFEEMVARKNLTMKYTISDLMDLEERFKEKTNELLDSEY